MARLSAALLWIVCAAFVAYLSFVPFRFQLLAFDDALARFAQTPYLHLGAGNRADWVANILMFVPLGWLAAAFFVPHPRSRFDLVAVVPSLLLGVAWAVGVEFGQLYFPGRTVSINDILAEVIGTFLGAWLWSAFGESSRGWWRTLRSGGRATVNASLAAYLLAYLVLSFSPFDFVISADELARKAAANLHGWWLAPVSCGRTPCSVKLLVEALAVLPFGWWLAMRRRESHGLILRATALGAGLGVSIELAQFLLVSGTSQGASVVLRVVGVTAGAWLHTARHRLRGIDWVFWGRPLVLIGLIPYLAVVAYVGGWFAGPWLGLEAGVARAGQIQWMPFFYQYYSTEQALIRSTLVHLFLYVPMGAAVWLWGRRSNSASGWVAAMLAAAVAIVAETGKLFVKGKHPDYTDVLFAMAAALTTAALLRRASRAATGGGAPLHERTPMPRAEPAFAMATIDRAHSKVPRLANETAAAALDVPFSGGVAASLGRRAVAAVVLLMVAVSLVRFPVWQVPLAMGLVAYAGLLARRPLAYLLVLPVALPLLDLAPLSGRFFWDEFDLLLATTVGMRLLMSQPAPRMKLELPRIALSMIALSVLASTAVALWPSAPLNADAFASYLSPYNALRVAKGYLWGGALLWLLWRDAAAGRRVGARLQAGLGLGLLAAALGVFFERILFIGMADLGASFRAAGLVSANHVGGAYLEAMLVVLTPFALAEAVTAQRVRSGALWFGVALTGAASVLMTLSRAAAAAWLIGIAAFAVLAWSASRRPPAARRSHGGRISGAAAAIGLVAVAALTSQSTYLRDRLALSGSDFAVRLAHWRESLDLMRADPMHVAFGMGLGSFAREFYVAQAAQLKLPAYRLDRDPPSSRGFLSLMGGRGMYVDQRVAVLPGRQLHLRGQVRSSRGGAALAIALCEKSFLSSVRCEWRSVTAATDWQAFDVQFSLPQLADRHGGPQAPVSLSLHNEVFGTRIDVTQLSLLDGADDLLANGSFEHGLDRWLMFSDVHLAWRTLNTPVQVVFEQGLFGALAWLSMGISIVAVAARRADSVPRAAVVAALVGFVSVGCFDTLLDAPRLTVLAALILWLGWAAATPGAVPPLPVTRDRNSPGLDR